ncbi:RabGAP/TBC [Trichodelitschia bisporula]|uniref:GTPase-activating protein GYP7 n=1 Tax=Trichodelitschia bisporula TaxID=703511 RepID=A0A6G1HMZ8_9PEZI|nr:RabGAP/TBC [Trichodelitschia bisporula]
MTNAESPPSPTASFYAMSDDDEGEYNTIRHTKTGRGVKLLYTKSKVYIHPSPSAKDNIPGFIALIQQKSAPGSRPTSSSSAPTASAPSDLLLAWVPESCLGDAYDTYVKVDLSDTSSPPKQTYLVPAPPITVSSPATGHGTYAFAIPVSQVYSLLVRPPSIGWWFGSVVINTRAGDSFPALFFHDSECQSTILQRRRLMRESFDPFQGESGMFWGGDEVLRWLKRYVRVERAGADPNTYLIEPTEGDRRGFSAVDGVDKNRKGSVTEAPKGGAGGASGPQDGAMDPFTKFVKETRWNILEKLSQVTTFTRRTAQAVAENPKLPPQVRRLIATPEVQTLSEEFDSARIYLARWAMGMAEQSERERDARIWTARDVLEMEDTGVGEFELLDVSTSKGTERRKSVDMGEWEAWFDTEGRLQVTPDEVKERVFHGGLDADDGVRKEAWLFLLGVYEWDSSREERTAVMNSKRDEYIRLKGAWWERMIEGAGPEEEMEWWREQKNRIEKDVHRTDRHIPLFAGEDIPHPDPDSPFVDAGTNVHLEQMKDMLLTYNEYNKELGYVQGMSDLLAPIYAIVQDDAVAFWGFVGFMERMERNFLRDQSGMRLQLLTLDHLVQLLDPALYLHLQKADSTNFFFFFRMLLVWYKREFEWPDVLRLWEVLWTDYLSANFHLFVALAILEKHRDVIMQHLQHFDEVLKYVNELSNTIDLPSTLSRAEALFNRFQRTVAALDQKNPLPPPSTARRRLPAPTSPKSSDDGKSNAALKAAKAGSIASRAGGASSGVEAGPAKGKGKVGAGNEAGDGKEEEGKRVKVVSPELRGLLSRKVVKLEKGDVQKHGGRVR